MLTPIGISTERNRRNTAVHLLRFKSAPRLLVGEIGGPATKYTPISGFETDTPTVIGAPLKGAWPHHL